MCAYVRSGLHIGLKMCTKGRFDPEVVTINPGFPRNPSLASLHLFSTVFSSRPSDGCSACSVPVS